MKLYYSPGACSQAPHILLHELGLTHDSERVDLRAKRTESGRDYREINPKGAVPALELANGEVLTENAVVLQFLGDRSGLEQVLPPMGDFRRYRTYDFVSGEGLIADSSRLGQALREAISGRLRQQGCPTSCGRPAWDRTTIWALLRNRA